MQFDQLRREFITLLSGVAVGWPLGAHAQFRTYRIGALMAFAENDPLQQSWIRVLHESLEKLGWQMGRTIQIDYRWTAGAVDRMSAAAAELLGLAPDLLLAGNVPTAAALQRQTRSIPIVFVLVADPVALGFVASFAHPGENMTGFMTSDPPMAGKRLELLKHMAPMVRRVALMFNPDTAGTYIGPDFQVARASAASLGLEINAVHVHSAAEIENVITALGRQPGSGLFVAPDITTGVNRQLIVELAARHSVPAIYPYRFFATVGGLASYGNDIAEHYRLAGGYIDRILKGAKPGELPVQNRPSLNWSSISRLPRRSASTCRRCCSLPPTT